MQLVGDLSRCLTSDGVPPGRLRVLTGRWAARPTPLPQFASWRGPVCCGSNPIAGRRWLSRGPAASLQVGNQYGRGWLGRLMCATRSYRSLATYSQLIPVSPAMSQGQQSPAWSAGTLARNFGPDPRSQDPSSGRTRSCRRRIPPPRKRGLGAWRAADLRRRQRVPAWIMIGTRRPVPLPQKTMFVMPVESPAWRATTEWRSQ
jgi:hypothetical protein